MTILSAHRKSAENALPAILLTQDEFFPIDAFSVREEPHGDPLMILRVIPLLLDSYGDILLFLRDRHRRIRDRKARVHISGNL